MKLRFLTLIIILISCVQTAWAGTVLEAVYPYNLEKRDIHVVPAGSTMPLYINLTSFDVPNEQHAHVTVYLPDGFEALPGKGWQLGTSASGMTAGTDWLLPADYGQNFDLLYIKAPIEQKYAKQQKITVTVTGNGWSKEDAVNFTYDANAHLAADAGKRAKPDHKKFNWYIQDVILPVDNLGNKDDRAEDGIIYIRDTSLESFRNRMTGDGATNWSAVFNHPATFLLLDMRNPQQDIRVLKFKAELVDKSTGKVVPGLCTAGKTNDESEHGWAGDTGSKNETTAMISLDGKKSQTFILPLYVDYFTALEGDYNLRVTVSGNGQKKIQELPLTIAKKHSLGLAAVAVSFVCLALVILFSYKIKRCIAALGAKGAITVALFAAIAFGGIVLPTTLAGDLLHVFLGPFSGLVTGLLSGVLQYLLIMSLLVLFRVPGTLALMFIIKFMLSGIMFGHFTPLGILSCAVYIAVLEAALYLSGFYGKKELNAGFMIFISCILGLADGFITFINLEQMMFFYRLYYAGWYVALYVIVNGFIYSSVGSWLGYKTGMKLRQVMGE